MATDLKGLKRFGRKLSKYDIGNNFVDIVAEEVANVGIEIATEEYKGLNVTIDKQILGNGESQVVASAKGLNYVEFGTGEYAKGTYQGKLPTQTFNFESPKGKPQSTQGWEYYYSNPDTKRTIGGKHGWFIGNGIFTTGRVAGNQMFYTSDRLRNEIPTIVKKKLGKGVR